VLQCSKDADCKDLGATATCVDTVCHKGSTQTKSDGGGNLTCDQRGNQAGTKLAAIESAADAACTTPADCVAAPSVSCTNACDKGVISKAGLAGIQSALTALENSVCAPFTAAGCTVLEPPCVSPGIPGCVAGKCQNVFPSGSTDSGTASCDARANQLSNEVFPMLDALDKSCKVDNDCTRTQPDLKCDFGCPTPTSKTAAAAFDAKRASLEASLCDPYLAAGCMPLLTGCPFVPADPPKCTAGVCTDVITTTPPPDAGQTCTDRTTALNAELTPVVAAADQTCKVDGDCKVVMLVDQCIESCTYAPASASGAATIQGKLDDIDAKECGDFASAGCTVQRLPCVAPPMPKCNAGKCAVP
jgi:hypothetical protein